MSNKLEDPFTPAILRRVETNVDIQMMEELEKRKLPILQQWRKYAGDKGLCGYVYGHPNPTLPDGSFIYTSELLWIDEIVGLAQTRNTLYVLRTKAGT